MQYFSLFSLFLLLQVAAVQAQKTPKNDWESMSLKGKVKRLEARTYQTVLRNDSVVLKSMTIYQAFNFDESGKITETETKYPRYSTHIYISKYFYDSKNRIIKHENYKNGELGEWDTISYNKHNKVETALVLSGGKTIRAIRHKYDKKGLLLEKTEQELDATAKETLVKKETYAYDKAGNKLREEIFNGEDFSKPSTATSYIYKKNILQSSQRISDKTTYKISYTYSGDTTKTRTEEYDGDLLQSVELATEFKNGDTTLTQITITQDAKGKQIGRTINLYDNDENVIKREEFDEDGEPVRHNYIEMSYLYDEKGNETQRVEYLYNGNPLDATLRKIIYY
jgi:hypothetical protein